MNRDDFFSEMDPELEARIVAMMMGEASDYERDQLEELISQRPDLAAAKDELQGIHSLLSDVGAGELADPASEWKLDSSRRDSVLSVIDGGEPNPISQPLVATSSQGRAWRTFFYSYKFMAAASAACVLLAAGLIFVSTNLAYKEAATSARALARLELPNDSTLTFTIEDKAEFLDTADSQLSLARKEPSAAPEKYFEKEVEVRDKLFAMQEQFKKTEASRAAIVTGSVDGHDILGDQYGSTGGVAALERQKQQNMYQLAMPEVEPAVPSFQTPATDLYAAVDSVANGALPNSSNAYGGFDGGAAMSGVGGELAEDYAGGMYGGGSPGMGGGGFGGGGGGLELSDESQSNDQGGYAGMSFGSGSQQGNGNAGPGGDMAMLEAAPAADAWFGNEGEQGDGNGDAPFEAIPDAFGEPQSGSGPVGGGGGFAGRGSRSAGGNGRGGRSGGQPVPGQVAQNLTSPTRKLSVVEAFKGSQSFSVQVPSEPVDGEQAQNYTVEVPESTRLSTRLNAPALAANSPEDVRRGVIAMQQVQEEFDPTVFRRLTPSEADAKATVPDGGTIMLGGIVRKRDGSVERRPSRELSRPSSQSDFFDSGVELPNTVQNWESPERRFGEDLAELADNFGDASLSKPENLSLMVTPSIIVDEEEESVALGLAAPKSEVVDSPASGKPRFDDLAMNESKALDRAKDWSSVNRFSRLSERESELGKAIDGNGQDKSRLLGELRGGQAKKSKALKPKAQANQKSSAAQADFGLNMPSAPATEEFAVEEFEQTELDATVQWGLQADGSTQDLRRGYQSSSQSGSQSQRQSGSLGYSWDKSGQSANQSGTSLPTPYYLYDDVEYFQGSAEGKVAKGTSESKVDRFYRRPSSRGREDANQGIDFDVTEEAEARIATEQDQDLDGLADSVWADRGLADTHQAGTWRYQAQSTLESLSKLRANLPETESLDIASESLRESASEKPEDNYLFGFSMPSARPPEIAPKTVAEAAIEMFGADAGPAETNLLKLPKYLTDSVRSRNAVDGNEIQRLKRFSEQAVQRTRRESLNREFGRTAEKEVAKAEVSESLDEKSAEKEAFSTFSLHVSDVSFKLAMSALGKGEWPEASKIRIEEFVNAFDYHDPLPTCDERVACQLEQSIHPFLLNRNLMRVSMRTAETGRSSSTPLRLVLLLDNSGSMERPDRRETVKRAFELLTKQLRSNDQITLISFASTPRLLADKISAEDAGQLVSLVDGLPSEGGTNIEEALLLAFEKAREQFLANAQNRIVLLTDGAVNLGDADPDSLAGLVTLMRDSGVAFDAAGISAQDLNDDVLESLTRKGDGRYYLLDSLEDADDGFAQQIAGALRPAAKNVKVQIEFNPERVGKYKLLGFEKHILKKEDFRNDKVDAAEMAAAEAGVAVYQFETKPDGDGDIGSVSVRFRDVSSGQMVENRWPIPYEPNTSRPEDATPSMKVATAAAMLAAKLKGEALGESVELSTLNSIIDSLPEEEQNKRVNQLRTMIQSARDINGK